MGFDRSQKWCRRNKEDDGVEDILLSPVKQRHALSRVLTEEANAEAPNLRIWQDEHFGIVVEAFNKDGLRIRSRTVTTEGTTVEP